MVEHINVTRQEAGVWAVKQGDEYFAYIPSRAQAVRVGSTMVNWLSSLGRTAELHIEASFASDPAEFTRPS